MLGFFIFACPFQDWLIQLFQYAKKKRERRFGRGFAHDKTPSGRRRPARVRLTGAGTRFSAPTASFNALRLYFFLGGGGYDFATTRHGRSRDLLCGPAAASKAHCIHAIPALEWMAALYQISPFTVNCRIYFTGAQLTPRQIPRQAKRDKSQASSYSLLHRLPVFLPPRGEVAAVNDMVVRSPAVPVFP